MTKRAAVALGLIAGAFAAFIFLYERHLVSPAERESRRGSVLDSFIRDRLESIELKHGGETTLLGRQRGEDGQWRAWRILAPVQEVADADSVASLMSALEWATARRKLEHIEPSDLMTFGLQEPRAEAIYTVGGRSYRLRIGADDPREEGVYLAAEAADKVYVVGRDLLEILEKNADHYRDKHVLRSVPIAEADEIAWVEDRRRIEVHREKDRFWITTPERALAGASRMTRLIDAFQDLKATSFAAEGPAAPVPSKQIQLHIPRQREEDIRVALFIGDPATDTTAIDGPCDGHEGQRYLRVDPGRAYCVASSEIEGLLPTLQELLEKRLVTLDYPELAEVRWTSPGNEELVAERGERDRWRWSEAGGVGDIDGAAVERWLAELRASEWAEQMPLGDASQGAGATESSFSQLQLRSRTGREEQLRVVRSSVGTWTAHRAGEDRRVLLSEKQAELLRATDLHFRPRRLLNVAPSAIQALQIDRRGIREVAERVSPTGFRLSQPVEMDADVEGIRELLSLLGGLTALEFRPGRWEADPSAIAVLLTLEQEGVSSEYRLLLKKEDGEVLGRLDESPVFLASARLFSILNAPLATRRMFELEVEELERILFELDGRKISFRRRETEFVDERDVVVSLARVQPFLRHLTSLSASRLLGYGVPEGTPLRMLTLGLASRSAAFDATDEAPVNSGSTVVLSDFGPFSDESPSANRRLSDERQGSSSGPERMRRVTLHKLRRHAPVTSPSAHNPLPTYLVPAKDLDALFRPVL
ncbi:MAG: DUF4340 domain-containing protein [Myxococcota bacterium]